MNSRTILTSIALAALLGAAPAVAQINPNDTGSGTELGMQELNTSGQVGTATLYPRGSKTLVVLNIKDAPAGKHQPGHIHRGKECDAFDPKPLYPLKDTVDGRSSSLVNVPIARLLSGNYNVVLHSSMAASAKYVSCGHLHGSPG